MGLTVTPGSKVPPSALVSELAAQVRILPGPKLFKPDDMAFEVAIEALGMAKAAAEQEVNFTDEIDAYPMDGAYALMRAMTELHGFIEQKTIQTPFGPIHPQSIAVQVSPTETVNVPWGQTAIPGVDGVFAVGPAKGKRGYQILQVTARVRRKHEKVVRAVFELAKEKARTGSIYRGKCLRYIEDKEPQFLDVDPRLAAADDLVLTTEAQHAYDVAVRTPISRSDECRRLGIPLRRGILLEGPYGTGKTLAAYKTAQIARDHGWTFVYVESVGDFVPARVLAQRFAPAVLFVEDIDDAASDHDLADSIRNTVDGLDTKEQDILLICTTNHLDIVALKMPGLLRPGRVDTVISVSFPDGDAAARLVQRYTRDTDLEEGFDYAAIGASLSGLSAATIREAVERAKLAAVARDAQRLNTEDVIFTGRQMRAQQARLKPQPPPDKAPDIDTAISRIVLGIVQPVRDTAEMLESRMNRTIELVQDIPGQFPEIPVAAIEETKNNTRMLKAKQGI